MHLQMIVEHSGAGAVVVRPVGDVDLATAPNLRERLLTVLRDAPRVLIVSLDRVDFLDSTGLGALVAASRRATLVGSAFCLAAPTRGVSRVLEITHMDKALAIYPSVGEAVGRLAPPRANESGIGALATGA